MFKWLRRRASEPHSGSPPEAAQAPTLPTDVQRLLQRLEWTVLKRLDGQLQGNYRSLWRGSGLELADLREYQATDDVRRIDWAATARMQTPYVRQYQEDRDMSAWLLLDLSPSLSVGTGVQSKRDLALQAATVLGRMIGGRGNPVGALLHHGGDQTISRHIPARTGRRHLLSLLHQVSQVSAAAAASTTPLGDVLKDAAGRLKRRSTVLVISDFISAPGWESAIAGLARRHDVVAVHLSDPIEWAWPAAGMLWLQDAETGERLWVDTQDAGFRSRFVEQAQRREQHLQETFRQAGVDHLSLRADETLDHSMMQFLLRRQRGVKRHHMGSVRNA